MGLLYFIGALLACLQLSAQSCCCTGAGANYSILPNLDKNVVGLRYSFASYNTTVYPIHSMHMNGAEMNMMGAGTPAAENMNSVDIFARFNLPRRFQLSAFIPVHILSERTETGVQRSAGLGDISLLVQYSVFNPLVCHGTKSKHQLRLGAGIKLPTGKFSMTADGMFATDLQLGTGSVDFPFNAIYTYRYKKFGLNLLASYKKSLVNSQHFRFGDRFKTGTNIFYVFNLPGNLSLMPMLGADFDYSFYNSYQKQVITYTGGQYLAAKAGIDFYYKQIAISTSISPVLISISNWQGAPYPTWQFETGLYYNFATNFKNKKSNKNEKPKTI